MAGFIMRRLAIIPAALVLVNFFGYAYAHLARGVHAAQNPFSVSSGDTGPVLPAYAAYLKGAVRFDFGTMPYAAGRDSVAGYIARAALASFGLLAIAFVVSVLAGLWLGVRAVRAEPPRIALWLTSLSTMGLAMPSYFIGSLLIVASLAYLIWGPASRLPIPIGGFGWDTHLLLPALVLFVRPTAQIAQITSGLLVGELNKQYVVAARSLGHSWRAIFRRYALRNVLAPVIVAIAGSLRLMVGELIVVEWLFNWPGLGRLVGQTLVPANLTGARESLQFLDPPILATAITVFAALFLLADFVASVFASTIDPRLRFA